MLYYSKNNIQHIQQKIITTKNIKYPKPQSKFIKKKLFIKKKKTL